MDFNTSRQTAFRANVYRINNFMGHSVVGIVEDVWTGEEWNEVFEQ